MIKAIRFSRNLQFLVGSLFWVPCQISTTVLFLLFSSLLLALPSYSADLRCDSVLSGEISADKKMYLWKNGYPAPDYKKMLSQIQSSPPGTQLDFGDGDVFTLEKYLGEGFYSVVLRINGGEVLRVPKVDFYGVKGKIPFSVDIMESFVNNQEELSAAGVRTVQVDKKKSRIPKFIIVNEVRSLFSIKDLIYPDSESRLITVRGLSPEQIKLARERLVEFAATTWKFMRIGDMNPDAVVFDGQNWIMIDFGFTNGKLENSRQTKTAFDIVQGEFGPEKIVPDDLLQEIREKIARTRREQFKKGNFTEARPVWFSRENISEKIEFKLLKNDQTNGGTSRYQTFASIFLKSLTKLGREKLKKFIPHARFDLMPGIETKSAEIVEVGKTTVLYRVEFRTENKSQKAFLEVIKNIDSKKDTNTDEEINFPLLQNLKKVGKKDLSAVGPDFVLYVP